MTVQKASVYFLILTKNEEKRLEFVFNGLKNNVKKIPNINCIYAVVDDSTDSTREIAQNLGIEVVDGGGKGLSKAYAAGVDWAVRQGADLIYTLDGDGQVESSELILFWEALHNNNADMVIGSRFLEKDEIKYTYPKLNRLGVYMLAKYLSIVSGQKITDSHGGIRLLKSDVGKKMKLTGSHSYVQIATLSAIRNGFKVVEISSVWKKREYGQSRVVHSKFKYFYKMSIPLIIEGVKSILYRIRYVAK